MTKDEAKWVAYKLYRQARDHFDRQQPKEKRILEYLLTIRDPTERRCVNCLTWVQVALQLQQQRDDCAANGLVVMGTQHAECCWHQLPPVLLVCRCSNQLDKAVTPGPTRTTDSHDYMWTTPERLFAVLDGTIRAFEAMQVRECKVVRSDLLKQPVAAVVLLWVL